MSDQFPHPAPAPARRGWPEPVHATLLLSTAARLESETLHAHLSRALAFSGLEFRSIDAREGITLCAQRLHLTIQKAPAPHRSPALDRALASGFDDHLQEGWADRAARHTAAVTLAVAAGTAGAEAAPELMPEQSALRDLDDLMQTTCHLAASHASHQHRTAVEAVLWHPSSQMFSPERFLAMAEMVYPLPLFLHPAPGRAADAGDLRGRDPRGAVEFLGADRILGHGLRVTPAHVPLPVAATRAYALVAHLRATGDRLRPGDSFGTEAGERIEVTHAPDGALVLSFVAGAGAERSAARPAPMPRAQPHPHPVPPAEPVPGPMPGPTPHPTPHPPPDPQPDPVHA